MSYWLGVAVLTGIYIIAIIGVSVLTGFTGLFSLGHAGFMAIGAYSSALITKFYGVPIGVGLVFAMFMACLFGLLIGYPTLKLRGDYFIIATLGIGEAINLLSQNMIGLTGGPYGLTEFPSFSGISTAYIVGAIVLIVIIASRRFLKSKFGRNLVAIREDEIAAETVGISVYKYKMLSMGISCALCGLSGGLLAHYMKYVNPSMFSMTKSNELVINVVLGGIGSLTGSIIAACIMVPLPEFLRFGSAQEWRLVFYGVVVVLVILFRPRGLMGGREFEPSDIKKLFKREKVEANE